MNGEQTIIPWISPNNACKYNSFKEVKWNTLLFKCKIHIFPCKEFLTKKEDKMSLFIVENKKNPTYSQ